MNRKMQIAVMTLCMALLLAWGGLSTVSAQIGVDFNNGTGSLTADMAAGLFPYANWNLTTTASDTAVDLVDSSGANTGATVTWDSSGTYGTNSNPITPDRRMFDGQLWSSGSPGTHSVSFTGIPYASYAAFIYVVNDHNGHNGFKWNVNGNLATEVYGLNLGGPELQDGVWLRAIGTSLATANIANYTYFPNLSGADVTFNYTNLRGDNNAMICGIQIIPQSLIPVDTLTDDLPLISPAAAQTGVTPEAVQLVWHYRKVLYVGGQFKVYLKQGSAPGPGDVIATLPENPKTLVLPNLLPSTTYYWKVEVFQGANSKFSEVRSFITGAASTPPAIPATGRILHLDPTVGVTVVGAGVTSWADQSGRGNNVTQATVANQPTLVPGALNGKPVLGFSGTQWLETATGTDFGVGTGDLKVFSVSKNTVSKNYSSIYGDREPTTRNGFYEVWLYGAINPYLRFDANVISYGTSPVNRLNTWALSENGRTAGIHKCWDSGVNYYTAAFTSALDAHVMAIGAWRTGGQAGYNHEGQIAEIVMYNRSLTAQEEFDARKNLVLKYGLPAFNTLAPAVTALSPASNADVSKEEDLILRARALPAPGATVSSVEFFVNGVSVGTDTSAAGWSEYSMTWAPPDVGAYTIVALATDSNGVMNSASVTVNSAEMAPSVAFGAPSPAMSAGPTVDFPTTFTAVSSSFALTADEVTLAASEGTVTGTVEIVAGLLPRTPTIRVTGITGFGRLRVCVLAGAGTSPYGLGDTPTAVSPSAGVFPPLPSPPTAPTTGSKLWWDASNINGANNAGLTNGQLITSWVDRSGNGNNGTPTGNGATYTASVAGFNNKPAVTFHADKANEKYDFAASIADVRTVFWAIQRSDSGNGLHYILGCNTGWGGGYGWHAGDIGAADAGSARGEQIWHRDYAAAAIQDGVTRVNGDPVIGSRTSMYPLGYTIISLEAAGDCTADFFSGDGRSGYNDRSWAGNLAELIIYNRALNEQERNDTGRYLAAKYGKITSFGFPDVPTVELVYPTVGAIVLPSEAVVLKATATPGSGASIAAVEFYAEGELVGTATTRNALGQYQVSWTAPATLGRVLIFARALDNRIPTAAAGVSAQVYLSVVNPLFATVTGAGTKDGASWANAMTLDEAITAAGEALVMPPIYVKAGTYPRATLYTFTSGLSLYGGFAGTEASAAQRTGTPGVDNVTTLDGGDTVAGIFHNGGQSITLDRLTFTRSANSAVELRGGTNTVNNCTFTNNVATGPGGGIHVEQGTTHVTRSVFKDNTAEYWGGGGIGHYGANIIIDSCWFENNQAIGANGGAFDNWWGDVCLVTNSVFVNNTSDLGGGAIETDGAPAWIFNNTFVGNQSATEFSGVWEGWGGGSVIYVVNNIFSNHAGQAVGSDNGPQGNIQVLNNLFFNSSVNPALVTESGSVSGNPLFVSGTDLRLQSGSPAINKGLTGTFAGEDIPAMDYAGLSRFDGKPDLGAYEIAVTGTLTVTPDPLSFGIVVKETTSTKTLTLTNTGGNTPVTISAITLAGAGFALVAPPALPVTLAAGEEISLGVTFTAPVVTTRVPHSGTVTVTNTGAVPSVVGNLKAIAAPSLFPGEPPTVIVERSAGTPAATNVFPIEFNITFSEGVTGFELGDINWAAGDVKVGNITATLIPREPTGALYTVRITEITGMGAGTFTVKPVVPAGVCETVGKYANLASNTDAVVTYETSLFGAVITTTASDITDAATVTCTVTFGAAVKGADALALIESKLDLAGTSAGASIASVLEDNPSTAYTVEITTGGDGTLALTLNDDDTILKASTDAPLNGAGSAVIYGPMIEVDKTSPTLVSVQRAFGAARGTNETTVVFEVTFSDIVTGVDADDFAIACSDATADVVSVATVGNTAFVVCNVNAAVGPYALSVKTDATMTNRGGLGYVTGTPDPNEDYYILTQAPQTSVETWSWTLY